MIGGAAQSSVTSMSDTMETADTDHLGLERARRAFDLVHRNPGRAASEAQAVVSDVRSGVHAQAVAHWCLGRVHHDSGQIQAALDEFDAARGCAQRLGSLTDLAQIRMSSSLTLAQAGKVEAALEQLALAEPHLEGSALGRLFTNRAAVLTMSGEMTQAVDDYDRALGLLTGTSDRLGEARVLLNRGVALLQLGGMSESRRDLTRAMALAGECGQPVLVAMAAHNLGYLDFLLGRLPGALAAFAIARERYDEMGSPGRIYAALDADEGTVLLAAGFAEEAKETCERLIGVARDDGNIFQLAEGFLLLARAHLALGDPGAALRAALEAESLFNETARAPWAALAQYVGAIASSAGEPHEALGRLRTAAATLDRLGWMADAAEVHVHIGQLAIRVGDRDAARTALASALTRAGGSSSGRVRAAAWHATALLHVLDNRPADAKRAIAAGLRVVDAHRASLGASDLRARASADGVELAELGVRLALRTSRPAQVLRAAERWRAGSLAGRARAIDVDEGVEHGLAEMRRLERQFRKVDGDDAQDIEVTRAEFVRVERQITKVTRMAVGDPRAVAGALDMAQLRSLLDDASLAEYIDLDGRLYAAVVSGKRTRLVELPPREHVLALCDHLGFALRRLAGMTADHRRAGSAIDDFRHTANELDAMLIQPLRLGHGPVVVVPTGPLHAVPWSALATLHRPEGVTLAPSAAWWVVADDPDRRGPRRRRPALLVHGPDLPHAPFELDALSEIVPGAHVLRGAAATAGAVLDAMAEADLVHIAAHGSFRADNPMFSSLQMVDGSIYVHDLQRLRHTPDTVVLTACSAGRSGVYRGDELLGTGVALLSLGVRSVIAPLVPVRDESTATFAVEIHRHLAAHRTPSQALAEATIAAMTSDDPGLIATAAAFQCVGRRT